MIIEVFLFETEMNMSFDCIFVIVDDPQDLSFRLQGGLYRAIIEFRADTLVPV